MNKTLKQLFTALLLLCVVTINAQDAQTTTFTNWTSTNKTDYSTSSTKYTFSTTNKDKFSFVWAVSSESGYDWLTITLDNEEIIKKSGNDRGTFSKEFTTPGTHEMIVKYTKDGSNSHGNDYGSISEVTLTSLPALLPTGGRFTVSGITYEVLSSSDRTVEVSNYQDPSNERIGNVIIPPTITHNGFTYNVTAIGVEAFCYSNITGISIPYGATTIEEHAFAGCNKLVNVSIPYSVITIKDYAFAHCSQLKNITIPNGVTTLGYGLFTGCTTLKSIIIPSSVTTIGPNIFWDCYSLETIVVEKDNHIFDSRDNCNAIIETATNTLIAGCMNTAVPGSVTAIGDCAFNGCAELEQIAIPGSITAIGEWAFFNCSKLKEIVIPNSVTAVKREAFRGCSSLSSATLPDSITTISSSLFQDCNRLKDITLPTGITTIEEWAFSGCDNLKSITIPRNVKFIGAWSFSYCDLLTTVVMPDSLAAINPNTFYSCPELKSIAIPNGVKSIEYGAFENCEKLKTVINLSEMDIQKDPEANGYVASHADIIINAPNGSIENDFVFGAKDGGYTMYKYNKSLYIINVAKGVFS